MAPREVPGGHIGAVFPSRRAASEAIDELRRHGLADDQLGVAVREETADVVFERGSDREMIHGVERGILIGAPVGAIAGMTMLAFLVPGAGVWGVGGILAAGGLSGGMAGVYLGAFLGLAAEEHVLDEEQDWERLALHHGDVLVVVTGHGHGDEVGDVLSRHGGRLVKRPAHLG